MTRVMCVSDSPVGAGRMNLPTLWVGKILPYTLFMKMDAQKTLQHWKVRYHVQRE